MWRLSNKYNFSKVGFIKFFLGYHISKNYRLVYTVNKKRDMVVGLNFIEYKRIKRLIVDKAFRGRGLGKKLIPKYCQLVYTDNKRRAVGFYEKMGFKVIGKRNDKVYIMKR